MQYPSNHIHLLSWLPREKLLLLLTLLAHTHGTSQTHLLRALIAALQMALDQLRKRLDEHRVAIQTLDSFDAWLLHFLDDFKIQLVECLNVIRYILR